MTASVLNPLMQVVCVHAMNSLCHGARVQRMIKTGRRRYSARLKSAALSVVTSVYGSHHVPTEGRS